MKRLIPLLFLIGCVAPQPITVIPTHANAATVDAVICPGGEIGIVPKGRTGPIAHIRIVVTEDSQTATAVECDHADVQD